MIAAEPAPAHQPGERALNNPTLGLRSKAAGKQRLPVHFFPFGYQQAPFGDRERMDRLDRPAQLLFHPRQKRPTIMTITPDKLHTGKLLFEGREQGPASLLIGALSAQDFDSQQIALRIHQGVTFAAPRFFSPYRSPSPVHAPRSF